MDPLDFLTIADEMASSNREAARRTAISRAYFALFNRIKEVVRSSGIPLHNDASDHERIARYLRNIEIDDAEEVGDGIKDLRRDRNRADYNMQVSGFDKANSSQLVYQTRQYLDLFEKIDRDALVGKIQEYGRRINDIP